MKKCFGREAAWEANTDPEIDVLNFMRSSMFKHDNLIESENVDLKYVKSFMLYTCI